MDENSETKPAVSLQQAPAGYGNHGTDGNKNEVDCMDIGGGENMNSKHHIQ